MKFLMVSRYGEGANILWRVGQEGNEVRLHVADPGHKDVWSGLVPLAPTIDPAADEVVVFDMSGFGKIADELRRSGHMVFGGSELADRLEHDREFGAEFMQACGVKVPFTQEFKEFSAELVDQFLAAHGGDGKRFVFKPSGKDLPCSLTYCSKDDDDLRAFVAYCERYYGAQIEEFILQEFKVGPVVMTECYVDGRDFVMGSLNHTIEVKAMMNDGLGPATGCSGNLIYAERNPEARTTREGLMRMREALSREGYVGQIDLNTVVNEEGVWGLELTPRLGYDSTPTTSVILENDWGELYWSMATGNGKCILGSELAAGVRFSIPPYPNDAHRMSDLQKVSPNVGVPIRGWLPGDVPWLYWYEVKDEGDDVLRHSHGMGVLGVAMGKAMDVESAFRRPYDILGRLVVPNLQYRTDIAECMKKNHDEAIEQDLNFQTSRVVEG